MTAKLDQQTSGMRRHRHTQSDLAHRAVKAAVERCRDSGLVQSAAAIARAARVTESFLYRHESQPCRLCQEIFDAGPITYYRLQMALISADRDRAADQQGRITTATLQADLANAKATNHRLRLQVRALERRLGQVMGQTPLRTLPDLQRGAQDCKPVGQLPEMEERIADLENALIERDQELDAVRRLNTDLTKQLNHQRCDRTITTGRVT